MKPGGRPVRDIVSDSPVVTELATDMVKTRQAKGKTLKDVAEVSHYSISALSQATSGQCIPSLGIIRAYAEALEIEPEPWLDLRARAVKERRRTNKEAKSGPETSAGPIPAVFKSSSPSWVTNSSGRSRPALPSNVVGWLPGHHREASTGEGAESDVLDDTVARRVQQLVTEAVQQVTPELHGHPIANILSLCTVPGDLIEVLAETRHRSSISLQEIVRRTPAGGVSMSKTSLQKLLASQDLPSAEVLRAILTACEVPDEEIRYWLYHRARLELARERGARRPDGPATRPVRTVSYGSRTQMRLMATLPFVASVLTIVMLLVQR
ncbi:MULTISPECIES: helix-turn-helix transcriptional regulator [Streptomyces]|uniref:helix-turn-helix domain-containing protein n=1 Tax=Streptomyces TaxID=1883 RepID=UPI0013DAF021|nr:MULTISPECIES: helix-turn-helix transcriptional regulator [Streptomyces]KAF2774810.1 regulatory protein [Streptomyces sp. OM5714]MDI6521325.1 helix-turn-helix transcriptional regulator [Streptomyces coelicoflavus]